jgi:hypothetical protein
LRQDGKESSCRLEHFIPYLSQAAAMPSAWQFYTFIPQFYFSELPPTTISSKVIAEHSANLEPETVDLTAGGHVIFMTPPLFVSYEESRME